jgi:hypothetical protein
VATITGISSANVGVLDITPISPITLLTAFSIKSVAANQHSTFSVELEEWKEALTPSDLNLTNLSKSIGYLLRTKSPVIGRVQTAANDLQDIVDKLEGSGSLKEILESFAISPIPAVDRALDVMTEQGHDRARDLITGARFSEYKSTNYKTASRSGALMEAASKIASSDLIEPTKTRSEFVSVIDKRVVTSWADVDPRHDFRDIQPEGDPIYLDYFSSDVPEF